jgi:3' terminal RNA ribose 2'-O-methyltransferase Hen1
VLLTITNTRIPADDLSYLLHKHPGKIQSVEISAGKVHIFYPEVSKEKCTAALLLDIDPVGLVRKAGPKGNDFALEQYVNDRAYVCSSFMSAAIVKAYSSALNGRCKDKPELVDEPLPLSVRLSVLPIRGGEDLLRSLFEPLGYTVMATKHPLDPAFPEWGEGRYYTVELSNNVTLQQLLSHLYVLIPVCDNDKHYWIGKDEIDKLLEKGGEWLAKHPANELIVRRYLKHQRSLANEALEILVKKEEPGEEGDKEEEESKTVEEVSESQKPRIHDQRLQTAKDELLMSGAKRVLDLGCGEGKLMRLLIAEKQFELVAGMDVSFRSLEIAKDKLKLDRLPERQRQRIQLIQGSLTYRDKRLEGFDGAALVEVIEHLDEPRLASLERSVFEYARPGIVVVTTPNAEYNVKFENLEEGKMRHADHRFEWTRKEFEAWASGIAARHSYDVIFKPIGEENPEVGALSQMAVFSRPVKHAEEITLTD